MIKNILITGYPGCGKTTMIREILKEIKKPAYGFFTEEIRQQGQRIGFKIVTLTNKYGILAKKGIESQFRVSSYGVLLKDLEEIGIKEIERGLEKKALIVIDEIGTMELFSEKFKEIVLKALDSDCKVLSTITIKPDIFCDKIKQRQDIKLFLLKRENFDEIKQQIIKMLEQIENSI